MDVEMADGTEDILETCALLQQQLEVSPDTPNMIKRKPEIIGEKKYSFF